MREKLFGLIEDLKEDGWQNGIGPLNELIYTLNTLAEYGNLDEVTAFVKAIRRMND